MLDGAWLEPLGLLFLKFVIRRRMTWIDYRQGRTPLSTLRGGRCYRMRWLMGCFDCCAQASPLRLGSIEPGSLAGFARLSSSAPEKGAWGKAL
ncbi:hypothetical protein ACFSKY_00895 [Azotobacter chroococcum]|uniref:hypothetical protein n=1 Tax=Azotobacter chroococcum TaxID=353 RepID=UPI00103C9D8B|nr:hypothetical protein [Azotobacter chroococcum]TBV93784.1 hypothetical protein E0E53_16065 [Azotobacter chroococcum]